MTVAAISGFIVLLVIISCFTDDKRTLPLLIWLIGLLQGVVFLLLGSELIALFEWIQTSLFALIVLLFLAETGREEQLKKFNFKKMLRPIALSTGFGYMVWAGLNDSGLVASTQSPSLELASIGAVGKELLQKHFLLLPALALLSLLVLVGAGQITRAEERPE